MNRLMNRLREGGPRRALAAAAAAVTVATAIGIGWSLAGAGDGRPDLAAATELDSTATATPNGIGAAGTSPPASPDRSAPADPPRRPAPAPAPAAPQPSQGDPDGPAAGPRIEYFRVQQEPLCPRGTTQYPIEGRPVTLEWRVAGADEVTLSIDGPGAYATYPAEGGDSFSFACAGKEGDIEEHTYLLTAVADGTTVTDTLVVTAVVHEVTDVQAPPSSPGA